MASKKNRRGKANRRSPKDLTRLARRLGAWLEVRRSYVLVAGGTLLFIGSLIGGYWIGEHLSAPEPKAKYARIEDIPDLPKYTEVEPGQPRPTVEEKPRPTRTAAALVPRDQTWRRNAQPFRDLSSRPLVAIVIDDVGLDRPRSKRAWELPGPLTIAFLPYAKDLRGQAKSARARGH
jgi:uncharacterized protein